MKPSEIQVGKFYLRRDYPESRYLGIGKRKPWTYMDSMQFIEKSIVCVKSEMHFGLGLIFKTPDDAEGSTDEEWNDFYLDPQQ